MWRGFSEIAKMGVVVVRNDEEGGEVVTLDGEGGRGDLDGRDGREKKHGKKVKIEVEVEEIRTRVCVLRDPEKGERTTTVCVVGVPFLAPG